MDLHLTGKTAVITGGSGGIGYGLVMEFAREGANVVNASRNAVFGEEIAKRAAAEGLPGKVIAVATDVTDRASVDAMVARANEVFGPVDILVNNAGGIATRGGFEEILAEDRAKEIRLNIDGVTNCIQAVSHDMLSRKTGSIVNISSLAALDGQAGFNSVHYGSVKGFVQSLSRTLAYEWGPKGIRVNDIAPGWTVPYDLTDVGEGSAWKRIALRTPAEMEQDLKDGKLRNTPEIPVGRLGRPEDIAKMACFLASDVAGYITGQCVAVCGGVWQN
jgi:NAD(P)-dependent dehydrogenase (short-subunit alcohol dehydrogenase family)